LIGKLNSAKVWPTSEEERALVTRQEKERLKKAHKVAM